ncbi:sensor histidine kinase [Catenulispora subtropica]
MAARSAALLAGWATAPAARRERRRLAAELRTAIGHNICAMCRELRTVGFWQPEELAARLTRLTVIARHAALTVRTASRVIGEPAPARATTSSKSPAAVVVGIRTLVDLRRRAQARERARVARDLHDLLSFDLAAIVVQGELCLRLLHAGSGRLPAELERLPELAGRVLSELRTFTDGPLDLHLNEELDVSAVVLDAAGIRATVIGPGTALDRETDRVLSAVLREAVVNVLRHSAAGWCRVTVTATDDRVTLRVLNDGAPPLPTDVPVTGSATGSGLANLRTRTRGRLTAGHLPPDRFQLTAELPRRHRRMR